MPLIESKLSKTKKNTEEMTVANFDKVKFEEGERKEQELRNSQSAIDMAGQIRNITYTDLVNESNNSDD